MTTELTPCPNCGEPSNNGRTCRLCESEDAMNKALTQRPAAQTERGALRWTVSVEPVAVSGEPDAHCLRASIGNQAFHIGPDYMDTKQEAEFFAEMFLHAIEVGHRASLPTTSGWVETSAPPQRLDWSDTQQATPEPVPAEQAKWCEYVAGMVDCWVSAEWSNYHHMDEDRRVKAIAGIIERRLWALQKQAATPEPVGEVVYQIRGEAFECPHAWRDATEEAFYTTPAADRRILYTRPAPGVPEPVGEPVARVELMQTGGNAGLATRSVEIDDPLRERLRPGDVLYDRPAPGVPELPGYGRVGATWKNPDGSISTLVDNGDGTLGTHTTGLPKTPPLVIDHAAGTIKAKECGK